MTLTPSFLRFWRTRFSGHWADEIIIAIRFLEAFFLSFIFGLRVGHVRTFVPYSLKPVPETKETRLAPLHFTAEEISLCETSQFSNIEDPILLRGKMESSSSQTRHPKKSKKEKKSKKKKSKKERRSRDRSFEKSCTTAQQLEPVDFNREHSHREAVDLLRKTVDKLLSEDPLLSDLPSGITLEEVHSQIALEHGQAFCITVDRKDNTSFQVIVHQEATVLDLKKAIQRAAALQLDRQKRSIALSWKYIWRTYWLFFNGQKLKEDRLTVRSYGIANHDHVTFIKKLTEK